MIAHLATEALLLGAFLGMGIGVVMMALLAAARDRDRVADEVFYRKLVEQDDELRDRRQSREGR